MAEVKEPEVNEIVEEEVSTLAKFRIRGKVITADVFDVLDRLVAAKLNNPDKLSPGEIMRNIAVALGSPEALSVGEAMRFFKVVNDIADQKKTACGLDGLDTPSLPTISGSIPGDCDPGSEKPSLQIYPDSSPATPSETPSS